jgi:ABC-type antimicrobial peptide transport system permease subunit
MQETFGAVAWAVIFTVAGGLIGICLVLLATLFIPKVLARLTPNMNEDKEIANGNQAVAEYFGRIVAATIIGISIVIAAAIFAGVMAALY